MRSLTHCYRCNGGGTDGAADDLRREGRSNLLHTRLQLWIRRIFTTKNRIKDRFHGDRGGEASRSDSGDEWRLRLHDGISVPFCSQSTGSDAGFRSFASPSPPRSFVGKASCPSLPQSPKDLYDICRRRRGFLADGKEDEHTDRTTSRRFPQRERRKRCDDIKDEKKNETNRPRDLSSQMTHPMHCCHVRVLYHSLEHL